MDSALKMIEVGSVHTADDWKAAGDQIKDFGTTVAGDVVFTVAGEQGLKIGGQILSKATAPARARAAGAIRRALGWVGDKIAGLWRQGGKGTGSPSVQPGPMPSVTPHVQVVAPESAEIAVKSAGAARAARNGKNWQRVSAKETIGRLAGQSPVVELTASGKSIYRNPETGIQVVYDNDGKYFRVENPAAQGTGRYLDQFGKPIPNNVPLVRPDKIAQTGVPGDVRDAITHFMDAD